MRSFYILIFSLFSIIGFGQDYQYANPLFYFENGTKQKVLVDETNIRQSADIKASIIATLPAGEIITVLEDTEKVLTLGNRSAKWYKIRFDSEGQKKVGYIWGANLSVGYRHYKGFDFLFGVEGSEGQKVKMVVKILKDKGLIQNYQYIMDADGLNGVSFNWLGSNKGLGEPVENILVAEISGEGCGIPTFTKYFLWGDGKLVGLPILTMLSDAGGSSHVETYIFPDDKGGKKGQIILDIEDVVNINDSFEEEEEPDYRTTRSKKVYQINQMNIRQIK